MASGGRLHGLTWSQRVQWGECFKRVASENGEVGSPIMLIRLSFAVVSLPVHFLSNMSLPCVCTAR